MKKMRLFSLVAVAVALCVGAAQAAIDTTEVAAIQADALSWVAYGVAAFLALLGAGLTIVAGRWVYRKIKGGIAAAAVLIGLCLANSASAEIVTTELDAIKTDATAWITYGVSAFLALLGAGLTIVAGRWVYRKIKGGIASA